MTVSAMNDLFTHINDIIWSYVLIGALVACGLWFTLKTKGVQFCMVGEMFRLLTDSATSSVSDGSDKHSGGKHISSFQAFAVSVATRVGTGNLAGVATAIAIGGPGAVFWMWAIFCLWWLSSRSISNISPMCSRSSSVVPWALSRAQVEPLVPPS